MDLVFVTDSRFGKSKNCIYNINGSLGDVLWARYLEHFDTITVIARVQQDAPTNNNAPQTTDPRVKFVHVPYYIGPLQFIRNKKNILKTIETYLHDKKAAYIIRLPSTLGNLAINKLLDKHIPFAVEVVGDPKDSLSYTATKKIIPALLSKIYAKNLRKNVINAKVALYVTNETLQKRYPICKNGFEIGVSDVIIDHYIDINEIRSFPTQGVIKLLAIGSLEQMYKSPDIVIKAVNTLVNKGLNIQLTWLGDGKYRESMKMLANKLGLANNVDFVGNVNRNEVFEYMRMSDIYIQASRTEGLPRALVEAMSVGLPCIGTRVGGIPELLEDRCLIDVNRSDQLAVTIERMIEDNSFVNDIKIRNYNKSKEFNHFDLKARRDEFFNKVKEIYQ